MSRIADARGVAVAVLLHAIMRKIQYCSAMHHRGRRGLRIRPSDVLAFSLRRGYECAP